MYKAARADAGHKITKRNSMRSQLQVSCKVRAANFRGVDKLRAAHFTFTHFGAAPNNIKNSLARRFGM